MKNTERDKIEMIMVYFIQAFVVRAGTETHISFWLNMNAMESSNSNETIVDFCFEIEIFESSIGFV